MFQGYTHITISHRDGHQTKEYAYGIPLGFHIGIFNCGYIASIEGTVSNLVGILTYIKRDVAVPKAPGSRGVSFVNQRSWKMPTQALKNSINPQTKLIESKINCGYIDYLVCNGFCTSKTTSVPKSKCFRGTHISQ